MHVLGFEGLDMRMVKGSRSCPILFLEICILQVCVVYYKNIIIKRMLNRMFMNQT